MKDGVVDEAISFLLQKDNVTSVSWGDIIDCVLSKDETIVLPRITGRVSRRVSWDIYQEAYTCI